MWILVTTAVALWAVSPMRATPLDDYVHREDPHYQYSEIGAYRGPEYTMYTLNMTSQKWKTGRFRLFTKCMILKKQEDLNALVNEWMHIHRMSSGNFWFGFVVRDVLFGCYFNFSGRGRGTAWLRLVAVKRSLWILLEGISQSISIHSHDEMDLNVV